MSLIRNDTNLTALYQQSIKSEVEVKASIKGKPEEKEAHSSKVYSCSFLESWTFSCPIQTQPFFQKPWNPNPAMCKSTVIYYQYKVIQFSSIFYFMIINILWFFKKTHCPGIFWQHSEKIQSNFMHHIIHKRNLPAFFLLWAFQPFGPVTHDLHWSWVPVFGFSHKSQWASLVEYLHHHQRLEK